MINIVLFGIAEQSSVTWHYLTQSGRYQVVAFTVDQRYRNVDELHGLPVVDFERVEELFSPDTHQMIIPLGWTEMNLLRANKVEEAIKKGYSLASYVDDQAVVYRNFTAKSNTIIQPGVLIGPFSEIGMNCSIRTGSIISHHVHIHDHCFVAAGVTISGTTVIGERSVLGVGCVIRDGIHVAPGSFIGAGAVVVQDTQPNGFYIGVPAKLQPTPADQLHEVKRS
jgi:sugar O-acyltransferase (sialic acid O-acetyltransferase NeuD family)